MMHIYSKIKDYFIEEETVTELGSFAILWGMMEEELFGKFCTKAGIELKDFSGYLDLFEQAEAFRYEYLKYCDDYPSYNNKTPLERLRVDKEWVMRVDEWLVKGERNADFVKTAFYACFRIRNNLFHGEKVFYSLNSQRPMFMKINEFLERFIILGENKRYG